MKTITTDPVCGMEVEPSSTLREEHEETTYLFCSEHCRESFLHSPEKYLSPTTSLTPTPSPLGGDKWTDYLPLIVIVALTMLAATARQVPDPILVSDLAEPRGWTGMSWMHDFMGFFLVVFSMFKLFDLRGFADGFQMYDLLAKPFRPYAFLYPFLELALGLAYLARWRPGWVYGATIVLMLFGALGVLRSVLRRQKIACACMGTILRVPLSTVSLVENFGMAAMAAWMLF